MSTGLLQKSGNSESNRQGLALYFSINFHGVFLNGINKNCGQQALECIPTVILNTVY